MNVYYDKNIIIGDIKIAAQIIGIDAANARVALRRPGSKYHDEVVTVLSNLIHHRESLTNNRQK